MDTEYHLKAFEWNSITLDWEVLIASAHAQA